MGLVGGQYFIDQNGIVEDIEVTHEDISPLQENEKRNTTTDEVKQSEEQETQAQTDIGNC